ncbi:hypothetical protein KPG71_18720 [Roseovarius sp. PS-C2]|uniref:hypothetical protein n=1 Tax=Roseovarius sp. PS-C2 TaxID=2820814 RepID=UPI001C0C03DE|nr:hypothetical protein [Roseovarius sp. PS-C2]MBU3262059.1 hypothetical protein [Roseovarius sp. PS-C2]
MAQEQDGLLAEIGVTEQRYLKQLAKLEAETLRSAKRTENNWRKSNTRVSQSFRNVDQSANRFARGGMRNVSLQLSQVAQQASATGDPLRALAIQLPDLTLGFGTLGIAAGAVAGALLPLAVEFLTAGKNAEELEKTVEELGKSVKRYEAAAKNASRPTSDLRKEYGDLADEARRLFNAQRDLEKLDTMGALRDARIGIADQFGTLGGVTEQYARSYSSAQARLAELNRTPTNAQGISTLSDSELRARIIEAEQLQEIIDRVQPAIRRVKEELQLSDEAAGEFLAALVRLRDADTNEEQVQALTKVRELYFEAVNATGELTEAQEETLRQILESEQGMLSYLAVTENAGSATATAAAEASNLANEVSRAAQAALDFVSNLGSANLAGLRAEVAALEGGGSKADAAAARREAEIRSSAEFQAAMQGPAGLRQQALAGLQAEVSQARDKVLLSSRRSEAVRALNPSSSRGGGGGRSKKGEPGFFDATDEQIERLKQQRELLGETQGRVAELQAKWELLAEAKRRNLDLDAQQAETGLTLREEINQQAAAIGRLTQEQERAAEQTQFLNDMQSQLKDGFLDAIIEGESLSGVLEDLAKALAKAALQAALFGDGPLAGVFGTSGGGGILGSIFGGIFGRATGGPVRAGQAYQVGEHGRELFVPRTDGQIVNASDVRQLSGARSGGGKQQLTVNIHENASDGETRVQQSHGRVDVFLRKAQADNLRSGGLDAAMRDRFGLRPRPRGV